jgi:DNA-binding SARP family transcriptional activator
MEHLQISLLGSMRIKHENLLFNEVRLTPTIQVLLAYLLLSERSMHSRDILAEMFWSDHGQDKAHGSLNTALWRLRRALEPDGIPSGTYLLTTRQGEVGFNRQSRYWLDVAAFKDQVWAILTKPTWLVLPEEVSLMESAIRLYRGDLLEGIDDDWALRERESLRLLYLDCLDYLMRYYRLRVALEQGLQYGKKILELDPLREEIHRELMRLYAESGQRALAIHQYELCCSILERDLGIQPMPDTQQLHAQICAGQKINDKQLLLDSVEANPIYQAVQNLRTAMISFSQAEEYLNRSIQFMQETINLRD